MVWALMRSPWGRVVKAIREDEDAALALGKNAYWYKMQALIVGGVIGGFAGMVSAIGNATIQPDFFVAPLTFFFWLVLILGGVGRVWSPIIGAIIYWGLITFVQNLGRELVANDLIPTSVMDTSQIDQIRFWIVGAALALLMVYRPQGIFGSKEEMALDAR
jgi:branched-chain amino acid transport system permease protein